tara:strand:+ start:1325 stop:1567 length:243 start_codon:yes stop_codon:yes gene_type:complete
MSNSNPTIGDYMKALQPFLEELMPEDCDTEYEGESVVTVGFNNMCAVSGEVGQDPIIALVGFEASGEAHVTLALKPKYSR